MKHVLYVQSPPQKGVLDSFACECFERCLAEISVCLLKNIKLAVSTVKVSPYLP